MACWAGDFMLVCPYRLLEQKISVMGLVSRDAVTGIISDKETDHAPRGGRHPLTTGWPKGHSVRASLVQWMVDSGVPGSEQK